MEEEEGRGLTHSDETRPHHRFYTAFQGELEGAADGRIRRKRTKNVGDDVAVHGSVSPVKAAVKFDFDF